MKNKKILGMPIALFVVGLLVVGGATAALVDYLSNTTETSVEVKSPIDLQQSLEYQPADWTYDTLEIGTTYAGDNTQFYLREEVLSDSDVTSTLKIIIENDQGVDGCDEISLLNYKGVSGSSVDADITGLCNYESGNDRLVFEPSSTTMDKGVREYEITVGFTENAKGNYTATAQHVPQ